MFFPKGGKPSGAWGMILNATTLGLHIVCATFIGFGVGWYLDKWLGTKPWLTLLMLVLGVAGGFKGVYREVMRIQKQDERDRSGDNADGV